MSRKPSRQAQRTRRLLQEALISLVQEREFNTLRIQDITDRADLGRATFYMHYSDKEDLLGAIVDQSYEEIQKRLETLEDPKGFIGLKWALEYASEQPELFRVVLQQQRAIDRIRSFIVGQITEELNRINHAADLPSGANTKATAHIISGAILGTFYWWIDHQGELSPEEVKNLFNQILLEGIPQSKLL